MSSYNLPPDLAQVFGDMQKRISALERGAPLARASVSQLTPNVSIPNTGSALVTFNTVDYDPLAMWSSGLPSRLTVPTGLVSGVFLVVGQFRFSAGASAGFAIISLRKNSSFFGAVEPSVGLKFAGGDTGITGDVVGVLSLTAGDYVEMVIDQTSANTCTVVNVALSLTIQQ